jgi:hypothetical protein
MTDRPLVPAELKRAVLVEAGHDVQFQPVAKRQWRSPHIVPWSKVKDHTFDNLIALCPNFHHLYDQEKKIDRKAMCQYKASLALLHSR